MVFEHNLTPAQEQAELAAERAQYLAELQQEHEGELVFVQTIEDFASSDDERPTERNMNLGWGTEEGEMYQAHNEW